MPYLVNEGSISGIFNTYIRDQLKSKYQYLMREENLAKIILMIYFKSRNFIKATKIKFHKREIE